MAEIRITLEERATGGRYVARVEGHDEPGEMTYSRASDVLIIVDHTGVPDSLRGEGVGQALSRYVVDEARAKGFKIIPLCPFFKAQVEKHPEWADVISS